LDSIRDAKRTKARSILRYYSPRSHALRGNEVVKGALVLMSMTSGSIWQNEAAGWRSFPGGQKKIRVIRINKTTRMGMEYLNIYPKKLGILTPASSAMDFTMKLGALPM
jgi:hypothetical protein